VKKLLIIIALILLSSTCAAQGMTLGEYDGKTYILQTESVRFCSTPSCLYVDGREQSFVGASFYLDPKTPDTNSRDDVLTYSKAIAYETKDVLFSRDGTRFVLIRTSSFDINGNPIGSKDETVEIVEIESSLIVKDKETGNEGPLKNKTEEMRRRIAWSIVQPRSPGEFITNAVLAYAADNYAEVLSRSRSQNSITVR